MNMQIERTQKYREKITKLEAEVNRLKKRLIKAGGWEDKNGIVVVGCDAVKCDDHNLAYTAHSIGYKMRPYYYAVGLCEHCGLPLQKDWNGAARCLDCKEG